MAYQICLNKKHWSKNSFDNKKEPFFTARRGCILVHRNPPPPHPSPPAHLVHRYEIFQGWISFAWTTTWFYHLLSLLDQMKLQYQPFKQNFVQPLRIADLWSHYFPADQRNNRFESQRRTSPGLLEGVWGANAEPRHYIAPWQKWCSRNQSGYHL